MSYKSTTHEEILKLYHSSGVSTTIQVAKAMLSSKTHKADKNFQAQLHGEICESVLEVLVFDFIKRNQLENKGWFFQKGLILKDVANPQSDYLTELDFTVFTPQKIFAFECKSYGGEKKILDKGLIVKSDGYSFDVYDQHAKHFVTLANQLKAFRILNNNTKGYAPYQLVLFDFALGKTEDLRTTQNKLIMPCLNETNILNIFNLQELLKQPVLWDIARVRKAIDIIVRAQESEKLDQKHLQYVKKLHKKG